MQQSNSICIVHAVCKVFIILWLGLLLLPVVLVVVVELRRQECNYFDNLKLEGGWGQGLRLPNAQPPLLSPWLLLFLFFLFLFLLLFLLFLFSFLLALLRKVIAKPLLRRFGVDLSLCMLMSWVLLFDSAVIVKTHRKNKHLPYKHACDQKIKNV